MRLTRLDKFLKISLLSSLIFLLIYNVSFKSFELLTTARLAVLFLFFWALKERVNFVKILKSKTWILFLPLPYVALQYMLVGDFGQLSRFIHLGLYSFVGAGLVVSVCGDLKTLIVAMLIAIGVQAILIFISFFSLDYRTWFEAVSVSGSNYDATYIYRASGFSGAGGAALSLLQSLGVFLGWLLLRENKVYEKVKGKAAYLVFLGMLLSAISCVVVGRTGLLLSLIFMAIFAFDSPLRIRFFLFAIASAFLFQIFLFEGVTSLLDSGFSSDYFSNWAFGFLTGDDQTVSNLGEQSIPPLTMETFHGTGLNSVVDGANPSGHDSGFVQAYYSMGLPFSVIFFAAYIYTLFVCLKWLPLFLRLGLVVLFFLIEIKEPFVFKYSLMFVLAALNFAHNRFGSAGSLVQWNR